MEYDLDLLSCTHLLADQLDKYLKKENIQYEYFLHPRECNGDRSPPG